MSTLKTLNLLALALLLVAAPALAASSEPATAFRSPGGITFDSLVANDGATLTVTGPGGFLSREAFDDAAYAGFQITSDLEDGLYRYELVIRPRIDRSTLRAMDQARAAGDESAAHRLRAQGRIPAERQVVSGYFTIEGGLMVSDQLVEEGSPAPGSAGQGLETASGAAGFNNVSDATQTIAMDLIVIGSECVGVDCTSSESFGFDTLRLKENNLRIKFQDTSTGTFPSRDWQLTANDSANGGANKFSIDDIDGGRTPFTLEAGAPTSSLYVDDGGRIGLGTSTPVVELQVVNGDSPTLRLEQDGSSGFTPQTWDLAGNETNFFVRDVTNGSKLPFKVFPNAPTNSLILEGTTGDIGVGIQSPTASVHVRRSDGTAMVLVEDIGTATQDAAVLLQLTNDGPPAIQLTNSAGTGDAANSWQIRRSNSGLSLDNDGNETDAVFFDDGRVRLGAGGPGNENFLLAANGTLTLTGAVNATAFNTVSDLNKKENFETVDQQEILEKLASLPISRWNFIDDEDSVRHIGPMAQDFFKAFGLGATDLRITTVDTDGVALAAIQALYRQLQEKQEKLEALSTQNDELVKRLEALESRLAQ